MSDFIAVDLEDTLNKFNVTKQEVAGAVRHGVSDSANMIKEQAKSSLQNTGLNVTFSKHYSSPLIEGVKAYMYRDMPVGVVHIMGDSHNNDGTWRLRFFESGTKERFTRKGFNRGHITGTGFFEQAIQGKQAVVESIIDSAIQNNIKDIDI